MPPNANGRITWTALIHHVISKPFTLQHIREAAEKVLDTRA